MSIGTTAVLVVVAITLSMTVMETVAWHSPEIMQQSRRRTTTWQHISRNQDRPTAAASSTTDELETAADICSRPAPQEIPPSARRTATVAGEAAFPSWSQGRFSVTVPSLRGPSDRSRSITNAVANGLTPLLAGVDTGVGLLQVLNSTASLSVGPADPHTAAVAQSTEAVDACLGDARSINDEGSQLPDITDTRTREGHTTDTSRCEYESSGSATEPVRATAGGVTSSAVALSLRDGRAVWAPGQDLWLTVAAQGLANRRAVERDVFSSAAEHRWVGDGDDNKRASTTDSRDWATSELRPGGGSARFDFLVIWSAITTIGATAAADDEWNTLRPGSPASTVDRNDRERKSHIGWTEGGAKRGGMSIAGAAGSGDAGMRETESSVSLPSRGMGSSGGHVVGELRPFNEFSAERKAALEKALESVGVDPRELTESEDFFGTAALKSYNTFVRPRPKQLEKVIQEPVARAALRTAHQVAFLVRRQKADRAEYLRNKDASMTEAERRGLQPHPVVLVCDNLRSAYNVGSIFRSADTARVAEVITCGFTPHPGGHGEDKVRKTAFGSLDAVPHRHFEDPVEAVSSLMAAGALVCALETTEGACSLFDITFPLPPQPSSALGLEHRSNEDQMTGVDGSPDGRSFGDVAPPMGCIEDATKGSEIRPEELGVGGGGVVDEGGGEGTGSVMAEVERGPGRGGNPVVALVLGNEVTGVDERVLKICDVVIQVPVFGLKNSLNVASAGTVVLYEVLRQWALAGRLAGVEMGPSSRRGPKST